MLKSGNTLTTTHQLYRAPLDPGLQVSNFPLSMPNWHVRSAHAVKLVSLALRKHEMRARLAVAVQLQAACADRTDDGRVVHHAHLDAQRTRAQLQVRVRGGPGARLQGLRQQSTCQRSSSLKSGTVSMGWTARWTTSWGAWALQSQTILPGCLSEKEVTPESQCCRPGVPQEASCI